MNLVLLLAITGLSGALIGQEPSLRDIQTMYDHAGSKITLIRHSPQSVEICETYGSLRIRTCTFGAVACLSAALGTHYYTQGKSYLHGASPFVGGLLGVSSALVSGYICYRLRIEEREGIEKAKNASRLLHAQIEKELGLVSS